MSEDRCKECSRGGALGFAGPGFSRRQFLQVAGTGLVASWFTDVLDPSILRASTITANPILKSTARNCIMIFMAGAPSQVDMWDLKEGPWTPSSLAPTSYGDLRFPQGLLPKTANHLDKLTFVRSGLAWAAVHSLAQTWAQISRNPTGALGKISPHIGAVVALEAQANRRPTDVLPGFVALNSRGIIGSGYLSAEYAPFSIQPNPNGLSALTHPEGNARLDDRWALLSRLDQNRTTGALGKETLDMDQFYGHAKTLVDSPEVADLFRFTDDESVRYGSSNVGDSLIVARNLLEADRGARFIQVTMDGWDHHSAIYQTVGLSLFTLSSQFDPAFGALLEDLASRPGVEEGKTMLDETLVVLTAEFGRTVGPLNNQAGRDHYLRMTTVFAGGGTIGGRAIGQTDSLGDAVVEYGWAANRDVRPEDVTSTIYSALGIDYTTVRQDDPLGRGFEYVPHAADGLYEPVAELWT